MKYTPEPEPVLDKADFPLSDTLQETLLQFRQNRNFSAKDYIKNKAAAINSYFNNAGLTSAVVGVSGGVDSAVALGLLAEAAKTNPQLEIYPVLIPSLGATIVTNQEEATAKGREVCEQFRLTPIVFTELTKIVSLVGDEVARSASMEETPWSAGQLVSYQRTPILYYYTSLLSAHGKPGLLCGTTNYSEGGYIGYVGKASDGMVDLQLISDIYKSEVYLVAEELNIPDSILEAVPNGDMFDSRTDEQVFGASYDFLELYMELLSDKDMQHAVEVVIKQLGDKESWVQYSGYSKRLEGLHKYNAHKYIAYSPAVHLDVISCPQIPGGWKRHVWEFDDGGVS